MLRDRRTLVAVVALAVAGVAAWQFFGPSAAVPSAGGRAAAGQRRAGAGETPLPPAEAVRLAALEKARDEPADGTRNPFRFESRAPAPPAGGTVTPPAITLRPDPPAAPSGPPPPPPITLKFIGVVEKADGLKLAVLSPGDGLAPVHGSEGDIIDGRYRILKIGTESIELAYLDGRGRQTIRLSGQ